MRIRHRHLLSAIILEQSVELVALLQPSIKNTNSQRPQPQLLRARPWHHGTDLFLYLQVTHMFANIKMGVLFVSFEHLGRLWSGPQRAHATASRAITRVHLS